MQAGKWSVQPVQGFWKKYDMKRSECGDFFQNREAARPCTGLGTRNYLCLIAQKYLLFLFRRGKRLDDNILKSPIW
ncbi:hypothetical protein [Dysgonomonas reticulitermitis]